MRFYDEATATQACQALCPGGGSMRPDTAWHQQLPATDNHNRREVLK